MTNTPALLVFDGNALDRNRSHSRRIGERGLCRLCGTANSSPDMRAKRSSRIRIRLDRQESRAISAHRACARSPTRSDFDDGEESLVVWFPEEWLRDPASHYLREHVVDVPWDEPELLDAFTAMRREG